MPMLALACVNGHTDSQYLHAPANRGCETRLCPTCGESFAPALSVGRGLTYFEEGRARVIENLGGVTITSHAQHKRIMKERGVDLATSQTSRKGTGWAKAPARRETPLPLPTREVHEWL
jgi:phage terminase large subunit GpA-like protein